MNTYLILKHIHMTAAILSGVGFLLRGLWMMQESSLTNAKLVRVLPHIIDTVLLVTALGLVFQIGGFPLWVQVKIVMLFAYIALGVFAFRIAKGLGKRMMFFFAALVAYGFILSVAISKNPQGFLAGLI